LLNNRAVVTGDYSEVYFKMVKSLTDAVSVVEVITARTILFENTIFNNLGYYPVKAITYGLYADDKNLFLVTTGILLPKAIQVIQNKLTYLYCNLIAGFHKVLANALTC